MGLIKPGTKDIKPPRSWLERWWSPDPRKAPREHAARAWPRITGPAALQKRRNIRDISATGLYVVTEERWYPGTLVLLTLTNTEGEGTAAERSISVHSRAVRWGNDGVGLQFILSDPRKSRQGPNAAAQWVDGFDSQELDRFLKSLRKGGM